LTLRGSRNRIFGLVDNAGLLKQILLAPLNFIQMIQIQLNLFFKQLNVLLIGQLPPVEHILQLAALGREGFFKLNSGRIPEQVGFFGGQIYFFKMPLAVSVPPF
jgi:hypothetical protein